MHNHPWGYFTFILKGGYYEWVAVLDSNNEVIGEKKVWRGPGHFRFCKANSYHRIEVDPDVDCWTLFMPGKQVQEWGFLTHKEWKLGTFEWIKHDEYFKERKIK